MSQKYTIPKARIEDCLCNCRCIRRWFLSIGFSIKLGKCNESNKKCHHAVNQTEEGTFS